MKEIKANQVPETEARQKFDAAFKREAVTLWLNSGKSARQIAADLGVEERHFSVEEDARASSPEFADKLRLIRNSKEITRHWDGCDLNFL